MKSNLVMEKSQVAKQEISVGVDMGGSLWARLRRAGQTYGFLMEK